MTCYLKEVMNMIKDERTGAPFNMAISTLLSLREILDRISKVYSNSDLSIEEKQMIIINLTKELFNLATPLLKQEFVEENQNKIAELKPKEVQVVKKYGGNSSGKSIVYDPTLDKELFLLRIKIQRELQKDGYFMPPKEDPRYGWRQD